MRAVFNLENTKAFRQLEETMKKIPVESEEIVNDYLHNTATNKVIKAIKGEMPKSNRKKIHAKESESLDKENFNMGFVIKTKKKFDYLVFPVYGTGTSFKNQPNDFMSEGLNKEVPQIVEDLQKKLQERMEEIL